MSKKSTLELCEQTENLVNSLNNLDYKNEAEDAEFERLLIQMDTLEQALSGDILSASENSKNSYYIQ